MEDQAVLCIVVAFSSDDVLPGLLEGLAKEEDLRILVVDNASSIQTETLLKALSEQHGRDFEYVPAQGNLGFAHGVNIGLSRLKGEEVLAILNPDLRLPQGALRELTRRAASGDGLTVAVPVLFEGGEIAHGSYGSFPTVVSLVRTFLHLPTWRDALRRPISRPDWASGACLVFSRNLFEKVGGFDSRYFMYMEDVDWCLGLREIGGTLEVHQDISVAHLSGTSASSNPVRRYVQLRLSKLVYAEKWFGRARTLLVVGVVCVESLVRCGLALWSSRWWRARRGPRLLLKLIWLSKGSDFAALQFHDELVARRSGEA